MHAQRARDNLAPALGGFCLGGKVEVLAPQLDGARVAEDGALVDVEDARVGGVRGRVLDFAAQAALLAQAVERELPCNVGLEVVRFGAGAEDKVFVFGAFGD